jgi:adenylate cyclase
MLATTPSPDPIASHHRSLRRSRTGVVRTLICTDIVGFTDLLSRLGDVSALAVARRHTTMIRVLAGEHGGVVLEQRGDGFLLSFEDPREALACAIAIQRELADDRNRNPESDVHVRTSVHTGRMLIDGDCPFGIEVIVPFRLLDVACGDEIWVSERTAAAASLGLPAARFRELQLKGIGESVRATCFEWRTRAEPGARALAPVELATRRVAAHA